MDTKCNFNIEPFLPIITSLINKSLDSSQHSSESPKITLGTNNNHQQPQPQTNTSSTMQQANTLTTLSPIISSVLNIMANKSNSKSTSNTNPSLGSNSSSGQNGSFEYLLPILSSVAKSYLQNQ
jgi:hypothetical protein